MNAVFFEHFWYGPLLVTNMFDIDNEETDDIELAEKIVCPLPDGQWMSACRCQGKLVQTKTRAQ